jgi:hypothetical protein
LRHSLKVKSLMDVQKYQRSTSYDNQMILPSCSEHQSI